MHEPLMLAEYVEAIEKENENIDMHVSLNSLNMLCKLPNNISVRNLSVFIQNIINIVGKIYFEKLS